MIIFSIQGGKSPNRAAAPAVEEIRLVDHTRACRKRQLLF
jgi:hypothetical protein